MTAILPLKSSLGCSVCRRSALGLFVDSFATNQVWRSASAPCTPLLAKSYGYQSQSPAHSIRSYSVLRTTPSLRGSHSPSIEEYTPKDNGTASQPSEPESDVPWYLQVEPPKHPALLHEPPPLPDIPEGSPKLMEPLVKFASDELGLDDLNLLDLRELDPPAAIGPDLLMLFGTARSERHLHVSADRLVRWLRGRGIHAKADGLIGRNVLKTRLRRKARKEKLLGSSGVARGGDDGTTTGWICVNVGTVGRSDVEIEILDEEGNSTGFGVPRMGTTVVVQMMIESRRQELNLEKLWTDKLRRGPTGIGPPRNADNSGGPFSSGKRTNVSQDNYQHGSSLSSNRRFFSTSPSSRHQIPRNEILDQVANWDITSPTAASEARTLLEQDHETKLYVLSQVQSLLAQQSPTDRAAHLSNPSLSPMMQLYQRALSGLSPSASVSSQLKIEILGRKSGIPSYTIENLRTLFRQAQLTGLPLSRSEYLAILGAVFSIPGGTHAEVQDQSRLAMEVIDCMFVHGDTSSLSSSNSNSNRSIMANDVLIALIQGLVVRPPLVEETRRLLAQFEEFLFETSPDRPCPSERELITLLEAYADAGQWEKFWRAWRIPPQRYVRRSREMYIWLFSRFAQDEHRGRALEAIRWCYEEMAHEVPRVTPIGDVRDALELCLRVADPSGESVARLVPPVSGRNSGYLGERECVRIWHFLWKGSDV